VMYHGKLVEEGSTARVFDSPRQDYTRSLLAAIPGANVA
jgi:peptide/nickel transport system ATP-binding protein